MTSEPLPASDLFGLDCGPSYCAVCSDWPASMTPKGKRCHLCWTRDIAAENPVPLPDGKQCLEDLASIGVLGAAEKLAERWPNNMDTTTQPQGVATSAGFAIGDSVAWISQWARRDANGKMIRYQGILLDKAVDIPGWFVRRSDGKRVKVRTAIMRLANAKDQMAASHQPPTRDK